MTESFVPRPGSSSLVPTEVRCGRPVPIGDDHTDDTPTVVPGDETRPVKQYRRHNCSRTHRTYRALASCIWRRAEWVSGEGPFATLAHCGVLTVQLHRTHEAASTAKGIVDRSGCGGRCPCTGSGHDLVRLASPADARSWS